MNNIYFNNADAREQRHRVVSIEIQQIDRQLALYYLAASGMLAVVPAARHYVMQHENSEEDGCACSLCQDWQLRRTEVDRVQPFIPDGHRWLNCACTVCSIMRHLQLGLMAVANKRDLWIEMSYHAYRDKAYRERAADVMSVIRREIENPVYRRGWWSHDGGCVSMEFWLRKVDKALGISRDQRQAA